eukprot:10485466-Lingulodinium_polyedra.AAC.1
MGSNGLQWTPMGPYGLRWAHMDSDRFPMEPTGVRRRPMAFGAQWSPMGSHGIRWTPVESNGT